MDEQNVMRQMLEKGDFLRETRYKDFDFSQLEPEQLKWIKRLTLYSYFRNFAISRWEHGRVSNDMKIAFIESHSMKLGNGVFYHLEGKKQNYHMSLETWPYLGGVFGLFFFA